MTEEGVDLTTKEEHEIAQAALESTDPLHFPAAFPEVFMGDGSGFDVIVGNPPWEETTLEEDEFWVRYVPGLQAKNQVEQEQIQEHLRNTRPDLVEQYKDEVREQEKRRDILKNGPYPGMGTGDPDTYKAFTWRFWNLVRKGGCVGVVLPRSAFAAAGSEELRRKLLTEGTVRDLTFLVNNRHWVFAPVHPQYTITLASLEKTKPDDDAVLPLKGPFPSRESFEKGQQQEPHTFPVERALNWTSTASFPLLPPVPEAGGVFGTLTSSPPLSHSAEGEWRARPYRELDATNDKEKDDGTKLMHFVENPPDDYWPIFKGGSFDIWTPDTGVRYAWADPDVMVDHLQESRESSYQYAGRRSAFYEMPEEWVYDKETQPCLHPRIAFRDVTRATDSRTVRAALIPAEVFLTNKAPYFLWPTGDERDEAYLLGVLCSIPLDWYARRFVETTLNYHILNSFPIPRPGPESRLRERVINLSGRLASVDERYASWANAVGVDHGPLTEDEKQDKIIELDAVVAHLYGLSRDQLCIIYKTFHEGWDYEPKLASVLKYYDTWDKRKT